MTTFSGRLLSFISLWSLLRGGPHTKFQVMVSLVYQLPMSLGYHHRRLKGSFGLLILKHLSNLHYIILSICAIVILVYLDTTCFLVCDLLYP